MTQRRIARKSTLHTFVLTLLAVTAGSISPHYSTASAAESTRRPNVVLIMTDDQGWGDFGFHGNPVLKTPNLDQLAAQSTELSHFHVSPVCSPTRASLLTGRYNYRTGAIDTYLGRSVMAAEETTLAEMLSAAGYRTGIFGKWHLGDNYPSRSVDQGFEESLVHGGGGIAQAADPPGNHYFDPWLMHNGHPLKAQGYCSDVFTDAAMKFIADHRQEPFFCYLAFNCPHTPLEVPAEYHARYQNKDLDETTSKIYGMIANIDDNLGRLFAKLKELQLEDDTIVVFLTDNGPQQPRYNGVLRDLKGTVYDGGIHVACLLRWPGKFAAGQKRDQVAAHIDLTPTLLEACAVKPPTGAAPLDGRSLLKILKGESTDWPDRYLFFQWHRGDEPEPYRACAIRGPRYKLLQPAGREERSDFTPAWALFDLKNDPGEKRNLIGTHAQFAVEMMRAYDRWFDDVSNTRGYPVPRIIVGSQHQNPVTLTRQDWRGPKAGWNNKSIGDWQVDVDSANDFDVTVRLPAQTSGVTVRLKVGDAEHSQELAAGGEQVVFRGLRLEPGKKQVDATFERDGTKSGAHYVDFWAPAVGERFR